MNKEQIKEDSNDFINKIDNKLNDKLSQFNRNNLILLKKTKEFYIIVSIFTIILIFIDIYLFIGLKQNMTSTIIRVIYNIFLGLYFFLMLIYILLRLFLFGDFEKLKGYILVRGQNFIGANFFMTQKRILKRYYPINNDGKTFSTEGDKDYLIDNSCIWIDENNLPNSFYLPNIPNPISFDFLSYFKLYFSRVEKGEEEKNIKENVDARYNAENLRLLKNDKLMKELHRDNKENENKLLLYILIIVIVFVIAIVILVVVLGNKQPNVTIVQNVTRAIQ